MLRSKITLTLWMAWFSTTCLWAGWNEPVVMKQTPAPYQALAKDNQEQIHLVWVTDADAGKAVYNRYHDGLWASEITLDLSAGAPISGEPVLAATETGLVLFFMGKRDRIFTVTIAEGVAGPVTAATNHGLYLKGLPVFAAVDRENRLFMATSGGRIWRWEDKTWKHLANPNVGFLDRLIMDPAGNFFAVDYEKDEEGATKSNIYYLLGDQWFGTGPAVPGEARLLCLEEGTVDAFSVVDGRLLRWKWDGAWSRSTVFLKDSDQLAGLTTTPTGKVLALHRLEEVTGDNNLYVNDKKVLALTEAETLEGRILAWITATSRSRLLTCFVRNENGWQAMVAHNRPRLEVALTYEKGCFPASCGEEPSIRTWFRVRNNSRETVNYTITYPNNRYFKMEAFVGDPQLPVELLEETDPLTDPIEENPDPDLEATMEDVLEPDAETWFSISYFGMLTLGSYDFEAIITSGDERFDVTYTQLITWER